MSIDTLELHGLAHDHGMPDEPGPVVVQPALLAGEEREAPDPWIFRGTD
jgi:hypothetical protein